MSNNVNSRLLEEAYELIEYFTSTYIERILQRDIDANDIEALAWHVKEYRVQKEFEEEQELLGYDR